MSEGLEPVSEPFENDAPPVILRVELVRKQTTKYMYTVKRVSRICLKKVCGWEEARLKRHRKFSNSHLGFGESKCEFENFL
jgi:hypothetical protein